MPKIKHITVKVTYTVGLGGVTAPKKVIDQLSEIADTGDSIDYSDHRYHEVADWILSNIKERDCFQSEFEIQDLD